MQLLLPSDFIPRSPSGTSRLQVQSGARTQYMQAETGLVTTRLHAVGCGEGGQVHQLAERRQIRHRWLRGRLDGFGEAAHEL